MSTAEKIELILIPLFGLVSWLIAPVLPNVLGLGNLLIVSSAILLLQSLVRDIWLLSRVKKKRNAGTTRKSRCICVESVAGSVGVVTGILLMGLETLGTVEMTGSCWSIVVMVVMGTGYLVKDYVLELNPIRLRRDKDHMNIVVTWKMGK